MERDLNDQINTITSKFDHPCQSNFKGRVTFGRSRRIATTRPGNMLLTDQDPTQTCTVALVTDPSALQSRPPPDGAYRDDSAAEPRAPDAVIISHYQLLSQLGKGST